jgi:GTPase SAR1 family protein
MQEPYRMSAGSEILKDMEKLMEDIEQVDLHLPGELIPEKVILLLGETKAGKTTLMYYLLGKKLIREMNDQLGLYQMKPEAKIFDALIGNDYQSTTVYPNIPTELGEDNVLVIDMPGTPSTI